MDSQTTAELEALIGRAAEIIVSSERVVVFTGAGVSTESGIPDFRGPDGVWTKYNPADFTFDKYLSNPETRRKSWERFRAGTYTNARPNPAHQAIAALDALGKLDCVITQNIDGLHQIAGTPPEKVIELHGTGRCVKCLDCGLKLPREAILPRLEAGEIDLDCAECGGLLKTATISFGQSMPVRELEEAARRSRLCDCFIVVGSSLVVYPAAYMPHYALEAGARLIMVNLADTDLDHRAAVLFLAKAGEILPRLVDGVRARLGR